MRSDISWSAVEAAMRRSVTGTSNEADFKLCVAHKTDPKRYAELSARVRKEEQDKVGRW